MITSSGRFLNQKYCLLVGLNQIQKLTSTIMRFRRAILFFQQFNLFNALKFLLSEVCRKVLDRYSTSSYSQTGEDRIIQAFLGNEPGFYIDVGCNHPQKCSNTFELYKRGWKGIKIDANANLINEQKNLCLADISICAAISDKEHEVVFTEFDDSFVSSISPDHVQEWRQHRSIKATKLVKTVTLTSILSEVGLSSCPDLLCIDVEGHDYEVLKSLDLEVYRPRLIVVEMHGFDLGNPRENLIYVYLVSNGYRMAGFVIMNGYFVDVQGHMSNKGMA